MEILYNIMLLFLVIGIAFGVLYMAGSFMGMEGNRTAGKAPNVLAKVNSLMMPPTSR